MLTRGQGIACRRQGYGRHSESVLRPPPERRIFRGEAQSTLALFLDICDYSKAADD